MSLAARARARTGANPTVQAHDWTKRASRLLEVPPRDDQLGLRLAAQAADRVKAAQQQWPRFEQRLRELGYSPRSIAYAFSILSGPGTVTEALDALERAQP